VVRVGPGDNWSDGHRTGPAMVALARGAGQADATAPTLTERPVRLAPLGLTELARPSRPGPDEDGSERGDEARSGRVIGRRREWPGSQDALRDQAEYVLAELSRRLEQAIDDLGLDPED
jgi:hypothetical protein